MSNPVRRLVDRAAERIRSVARAAATLAVRALAKRGPAAAGETERHPPLSDGSHSLPRRSPTRDAAGADFRPHKFRCAAGSRAYRLYLPPAPVARPLPLVVMLHGCKQTAEDFALGTRMNQHAARAGCAVVYPGQSRLHNPSGCWNWFRPSDQLRDHGEPAIIAGLTRELLRTQPLDPARVYVAGLSAGGAMATILGAAYPDLYVAVGVHSGVPQGVAVGLASALAAMRHGSVPVGTAPDAGTPAPAHRQPVIVFHGDADTTVNPRNAAEVYLQSVPGAGRDGAATGESLRETVETRAAPGGRRYTRTAWVEPGGAVIAELWVVHGAGHAWSGGDPAGSYTDAEGPDASVEMLRFFLGHRRGR